MADFNALFSSFNNIKAGVIGDVMLDTYLWGYVERISPEAPVPVVTLERREYRIGGAGNVALNMASLGAEVTSFSVLGDDEDGTLLTGLLTDKHIRTSGFVRSTSRITTNKARIISRNQQMLRLDAETTDDLTPAEEQQLMAQIEKYVREENPQVIVLEDYNKGVLTHNVIDKTIALCKANGIVTTVDPKRKHFFDFIGVDIFKPNLKEVREGLNLLVEDVSLPVLKDIHKQLSAKLQNNISLVTLSEKGIFFQQDAHAEIIPSHFRNIADVSGAGDTVIAVASLVYAATHDVQLMASMANIAGGLVCEQVGTVAIDKKSLMDECRLLLQ